MSMHEHTCSYTFHMLIKSPPILTGKCEMEKSITIEEFLTRSELSQHDEGDCLPSEFKSQLPEHVKLTLLQQFWQKLSHP